MSLLDWRKPCSTAASLSTPVVLHKPDLCARCDTFGRPMCVNCKDEAAEKQKESEETPMTAEEIREFFAPGTTASSLRPR